MRKLTCHCEQVFNVDIPEVVNLDSNPEIIGQICDGSFLTCICPACNAVLHTDLETRFEWPSKKTTIVLIPEIDRFSFLSGNIHAIKDASVVIGYPELADRIAVLTANLAPLAIESVKYHLAVKARETNPDAKLTILFEKLNENKDLEFHIHGLKKDEVAVTVIPLRIYQSIKDDSEKNPDSEPYSSLQNGSYLSIQNILIEDSHNA